MLSREIFRYVKFLLMEDNNDNEWNFSKFHQVHKIPIRFSLSLGHINSSKTIIVNRNKNTPNSVVILEFIQFEIRS